MMRHLILAACAALILSACTPGTEIASSSASTAATTADTVGLTPPAPFAHTTIDEKALTLSAKAVSAVALSSSALVKFGIITRGSPTALRLAGLLDTARDGVLAAAAAREAGSADSYTAALASAEDAVDRIKAIIAEVGA